MMPAAEFDAMHRKKTAYPGLKFVKLLEKLGTACINVIQGFGHLAFAVIAASILIIKGAALSLAALFFETGLANVVAGVAKSLFIVEESLAAVVDRLIDGGSRFINSLRTAYKALFTTTAKRHKAFNSDTESDAEEIVFTTLEITEEDLPTAPISPNGMESPVFFQATHICQSHVHAFNNLVSHGGNAILNCYEQNKAAFLSAYDFEWQKDTMTRTRSNSNNSHTACI